MPEPVQVSTVGPDDAGWPAYVGLFADYRAYYGRQPPEQDACDRWLREHLRAARLSCYLATTGSPGRPAAMALVVVSPASQALGVFWQLRDLFVVPDQRRAGVGRAVVTRVADDARAAGALRLALMTENGNLPAQALYRGLGFEVQSSHVHLLLTL